MIGKYLLGKSFRACLLYCLLDKRLKQDGLTTVKDRAEVLLYHQCYGSAKELIQQFTEVQRLNQKVTKPVLHLTLSLAPGERLGHDTLSEIVERCAKDLGFENNQYVAITHRDTEHPHLHIVANRIGFDGMRVSDSHSYQKMAAFCRQMELKYDLKQVLSPRRYLSQTQRQIPRMDQRKVQLKADIRASLAVSCNYVEFEWRMKEKKYQVIKARGIAFRDAEQVYAKGSELGYSLQKIEHVLSENKMRLDPLRAAQAQRAEIRLDTPCQGNRLSVTERQDATEKLRLSPAHAMLRDAAKVMDHVLRPEMSQEQVPRELVQHKKKQSKRLYL